MSTATCNRCKETKPQEDFVKASNRKSGYQNHCKECEAARSRARKALYTDEEKAYINRNRKNWKRDTEKIRVHDLAKAKRRRELEKKYPPLPKNVLSILKSMYTVCLSCGTDQDLQRDHVIPLSKGGPNTMENLQLLCLVCNAKKGTKDTDYR